MIHGEGVGHALIFLKIQFSTFYKRKTGLTLLKKLGIPPPHPTSCMKKGSVLALDPNCMICVVRYLKFIAHWQVLFRFHRFRFEWFGWVFCVSIGLVWSGFGFIYSYPCTEV